MINVFRNPNFQNWFNILYNGKLVDNAKTYAKAMEIAKRLSESKQAPIISTKK